MQVVVQVQALVLLALVLLVLLVVLLVRLVRLVLILMLLVLLVQQPAKATAPEGDTSHYHRWPAAPAARPHR